MDIACFIPLHFHHQDSGSLALTGTHWHCTDTCFVNSLAPAFSHSSSKKRRAYHTTSSFEPSGKKRLCKDMLPRRRSACRSARTRSSSRPQHEHHHHQQASLPLQLGSDASQDIATVNSMEEDLHHLRDEWATIDIVLHSLRNAFTVHPLESATEEHLDDVDRELSIAYDDLKAQVRHLERSLHRLDTEINTFRAPEISVTSTAIPPENPSTPGANVPAALPHPQP